MEVTKDELEQYLKPEKGLPLITQSMYDDCLKRIQKRDKYIEEAEKRNKEELEEIKRTVEESTIKSMVQEVLYRSHRK
ncbi:MAG: hypothetical protein LBU14_01230 [Candidatus Peribacteria bacterium]|jgi:hypothetical protein|nr:hypothetical protein [Candidatus Peribacteria bacterium]